MGNQPAQPYLYTIRVSHYCEAGRWALHEAGIPVTEVTSLPGLHLLALPSKDAAVRPEGDRGKSTPFVTGLGETTLPDSWSILEVRELLDRTVGPAVRTIAYSKLLHTPEFNVMVQRCGTPAWQTTMWAVVGGSIQGRIWAGLVRSEEHVEDCRQRLAAAQAELEALLDMADGPFVPADRPGLNTATIAVCALMAPLVNAPGYALMADEEWPAAYIELVNATRATRLGTFVMDTYRAKRQP